MNLNTVILVTIGITVGQCLALSLAHRIEFTNQLDRPQARIVGGHAAKPHSHPYMVSLQLRFLWMRTHICGGGLLNERWVVTAAHCVSDSFLIRWLNMDAIAGAHEVDRFGPAVQISQVAMKIPHPNYNGGVSTNDIAVLKVTTPFTFTSKVQPIRLPSNVDLAKASLMLPGWGALKTTFFIPVLPSQLQELSVTYVPFEKCYTQMVDFLDPGEMNPLEENVHICTGPLGGGKAACNGDSGGPLVLYETNTTASDEIDTPKSYDYNEFRDYDGNIENNEIDTNDNGDEKAAPNYKENGEPILIGIVSFGISPCGEKGAPTVYTNVSQYMDFINSYVHT